MKRSLTLLILLLLGMLGAACNFPIEAKGGPQAWIDAPLNDSSIPFQPYDVISHGSEQGGGIIAFELSVDGVVIRTDPSPDSTSSLVTIHQTWTPASPGAYTLSVRVKNGQEVWSDYFSVDVFVGEVIPIIIPSTEITPVIISPELTPVIVSPELTPVIISPEITPTFTMTPSPTFTPTATASAVPVGATFSNLQVSTLTFYYHLADCSPTPTQVTFQITAEDPSGIINVEIFFRLRNKATGDTTAWDSDVMNTRGGSRYVYTLDSSQATLASFAPAEAWLIYQFVVSNNVGVMTHSPVYSDITLEGCR